MYRYFDPEKLVRQYLYHNNINLNNTASLRGSKIAVKVKRLRGNINKYFHTEGEVVFLPNHHIFKSLLDHNFPLERYHTYQVIEVCDIFQFADSNELKSDLSSLVGGGLPKLFLFNELRPDIDLSKFQTLLKELKALYPDSVVYVNLDNLIYAPTFTWCRYVDIYTYNPSKCWNIFGVLVVGFAKHIEIKCRYFGSSSFLRGEELTMNQAKLPGSLEIGTQNFLLLMFLDRYFLYLTKKKTAILKEINEGNMDFNLIT